MTGIHTTSVAREASGKCMMPFYTSCCKDHLHTWSLPCGLVQLAACADDDEAAEDAGEEDEQPQPVQVPQQLELPLPENIKEEVKQQWGSLAAAVESLRPIERFRVVGLAYRRHEPHLFSPSTLLG